MKNKIFLTIITPNYNGKKFIKRCIENVINQKCPYIEHLIMDNKSTDGSLNVIKKYSKKYPHIRYFSEKDKGQSDAMNKGIIKARGEIISFLNVDDFYEPNTLNYILKIFKNLKHPSLVVGNCNVWDDDDNLKSINKPRKLKITDLLLGWKINPHPINPSAYFYHKSIHKIIGLYDIRNHYSMDLDFLLKAVQHANIKYIDKTFGNYSYLKGTKTYENTEKGTNKRSRKNLFEKFFKDLTLFQKLNVLIRSYYYKIKPKKRKRGNKKSILIVYPQDLPLPNGGSNIRMFYLLKALSKYFNITLLMSEKDKITKGLEKIKEYCNLIIVYPEEYSRFREMIRNFRIILQSKIPIKPKTKYQPKLIRIYRPKAKLMKKRLKFLIKKRGFDFIQVEHSYFGQVLEKIKTNAIKIIDLHNIHSSMEADREFFKKHEKKLSNIYDLALCCSEIDKQKALKLGFKNTLVVPNGVDTNYFKNKKESKPLSLLFIGTLRYEPNLEAVKYFLNKIYPLLPKKIKVNIIGYYEKNQYDKLKKEFAMKNIHFQGFVEDIRPFFKNSIFICPLLEGGGTRLKILTAFAAGSPVISTSKGAEGIRYTDKKNILIADSPKEFAKKIEFLFKNKKNREKIIKNARKLAESEYDWKNILKIYTDYLRNVYD